MFDVHAVARVLSLASDARGLVEWRSMRGLVVGDTFANKYGIAATTAADDYPLYEHPSSTDGFGDTWARDYGDMPGGTTAAA